MAIALDAVTSKNRVATTSSITWTHTCTGTNLILFVAVQLTGETTDALTAITYNGVAMTLINNTGSISGSGFGYLYYLLNPATGANTVSVTKSNSVSGIEAVSASYTGVKQSGQPDSHTTNTTPTSLTTSLSTISIADNCWGIAYNINNQWSTASLTATGTNTTRGTTAWSGALGDTNGVIHPAGSVTMGWTGPSGTANWGEIIATFSPVVANPPVAATSITLQSVKRASYF